MCRHRDGPYPGIEVQWAPAAATRARQGLKLKHWLPVTVIAELNPGHGEATGGRLTPLP